MLILSPIRLRFQDLIFEFMSDKNTNYEQCHCAGFSSFHLIYIVFSIIIFPSLADMHLRWKHELLPKRRYLSTKPHSHNPEDSQYLTAHHSDILHYDRILKEVRVAFV
jgi:hypothetical protein